MVQWYIQLKAILETHTPTVSLEAAYFSLRRCHCSDILGYNTSHVAIWSAAYYAAKHVHDGTTVVNKHCRHWLH